MKRRAFLLLPLSAPVWSFAADALYPDVVKGRALSFPRDHGAHVEYRTEWWYITGVLRTLGGKEFGVQVTFFRSRPGLQDANPSRFAPKQLLFAHAAIADPDHGKLRHDQRAARAGFGIAEALEEDTDVRINDWSLKRTEESFLARVRAREFFYELSFRPTQPVLLQGEQGFSQKGPNIKQASYYYSVPHLQTEGVMNIGGKRERVSGLCWMDHEWSSEIMSEQAVGWDWTGLNLADGAALMAFRMRGREGSIVHAGGALRSNDGTLRVFQPNEIAFEPTQQWLSPRTSGYYPVGMRVTAGTTQIELVPLMDDQELDSRGSVGAVYWEGAVRAKQGNAIVGQGYLELTGYFKRLRF